MKIYSSKTLGICNPPFLNKNFVELTEAQAEIGRLEKKCKLQRVEILQLRDKLSRYERQEE